MYNTNTVYYSHTSDLIQVYMKFQADVSETHQPYEFWLVNIGKQFDIDVKEKIPKAHVRWPEKNSINFYEQKRHKNIENNTSCYIHLDSQWLGVNGNRTSFKKKKSIQKIPPSKTYLRSSSNNVNFYYDY